MIKRFVILAACMISMSATNSVSAQTWPTQRPITLIAPFSPGGTTDAVARMMARRISSALGQTAVVENKAGAGSALGTAWAAKAKPDGYTLLVSAVPHLINPLMRKSASYDPIADFTPIVMVSDADEFLGVRAELPVNSVAELIDYLRKHPGEVNYGTPGVGSFGHFATEFFMNQTGVKLTHIPFGAGGSNGALNEMLAGRIELMFDPLIFPWRNDSRIKLLASSNFTRFPGSPDVPTLKEAGLSDFVITGFFGLHGPANLPKNIVDKLDAVFKDASEDPQWQADLVRLGLTPHYMGSRSFGDRLREDLASYRKIQRDANIPTID